MRNVIGSFTDQYVISLDPYRQYIKGAYIALTTVAIFLTILAVIDSLIDKATYPFANPAIFMIVASAILAFPMKGWWNFFYCLISRYTVGLIACITFILWDASEATSTDTIVTAFMGSWLFGSFGVVLTFAIHFVAWVAGACFRRIINWSSEESSGTSFPSGHMIS